MSSFAFGSQKRQNRENSSLLSSIREYLFSNNFALISSLKISFPFAAFLFIIEDMQKFAIVSRLATNPTISLSAEMETVDFIAKYLLIDVTIAGSISREILLICLLVAQLLVTLCFVLPIKEETLRKVVAKIILVFQKVLNIPSILLSMESLIKQDKMVLASIMLFLCIFNWFIYSVMQVQCSFEREDENVMVRTPYSLTPKMIELGTIALFPLLSHLIYPTSFLVYVTANLVGIISQWWFLLKMFAYFQEELTQLKGVLLSINISANICYLSIDVLSNAIISENVLIFIGAFSVFLGNFFRVYRNHVVKKTIINQELKSEQEIATFCVFYWHCYRKVTEKKNQLYLSSLLKKHMNECSDTACCCRHRELLYDHHLKIYGDPKIQPHFDRIFIRHYIRKLLSQGYEEHTKSTMLTLLLSTFDVEALEMITGTMELIHRLNRMEQKRQLSLMEQYLLYCLKQKTRKQIVYINNKRGNLDLESVKKFDEKLITLQSQLKQSVKAYYSLWSNLKFVQMDEALLYRICKGNLDLMFQMQKVYAQLKEINKESAQLRTVMIFYAKLVLHDIHLLSEVKKDIKSHFQRNLILSNLELGTVKLFGPKTCTMVSVQNGKIKWTSKNAHAIFGYGKEEFQYVTINGLMPKYFAEKHDGYIKKWKETGHHIKLNSVNYLWGSSKDGHCFSLLMFSKVVLLPNQQDYGFFTCIQKVEEENEVVCAQGGQIIGTGKLFTKAIGVSPKFIQETRPNIQIFMPFTFEYFLEYFFPRHSRLKSLKKGFQVRRQGYFPEGIQQVMKDVAAQRSLFERNNSHLDNYQREYLGFIKQKMQELTCCVNGDYISFLMEVKKVIPLKRGNVEIVAMKFGNPKRDDIERYYSDLEKMIKRLHDVIEEETNKKAKSVFRKNRTDFFKAFLNPRKVKRMIEIEKSEKTNQKQAEVIQKYPSDLRSDSHLKSDSNVRSDNNIRNRKSATTIVAHRKKLALGAQVEIKNQKFRYILFRIKNFLREEGIISTYTYNILTGRQDSAAKIESTQRMGTEDNEPERKSFRVFDQNLSDEGRQSFEDEEALDSGDELERRREEDNNDAQTFNSATSSATFISLTSQVKIFKSKLRSLNSPRPLLILNIVIVILSISAMAGLAYCTVSNLSNSEIGLRQFRNNKEANTILSVLLQSQFNIENLNNNGTNPYYLLKKDYSIQRVTKIFQEQIRRRIEEKKVDPKILSYLYLVVIDHGTPIQIREFIEIVINQIIKNKYSHIQKYFVQTLDLIAQHGQHNIFFQNISKDILTTFILYMVITLLLFFATLPIVKKVQSKINEIYGLLAKIGPGQKGKYYRHYKQLQLQFRNNNTSQEDLSSYLTSYDNANFRGKPMESKAESQQESGDQLFFAAKSELPEAKKNEESASEGKKIYMKIAGTFLVMMAGSIFYFVFINWFSGHIDQANKVFTRTFSQKSVSTINFIECNNQLMDYYKEATCYAPTIGLVGAIYDSYHLETASSQFKDYVFRFVTGQACDLLQVPNVYRNFSAQEISFCRSVNNQTFSRGAINNIYYCQRKIQQKLTAMYAAKNWVPNNESNINYPAYFLTTEYFEVNLGYFFNSVMVYQLLDKMDIEMANKVSQYNMYIKIAAAGAAILTVVFLGLWLYIYWNLAESASYINAFLLLIPYNILTENSYMKLYIKNEFDYKASNY